MSKIKVFSPAGEAAPEMTFADERLVLDKGAQAVKDVVVAIQNGFRAGTASTPSLTPATPVVTLSPSGAWPLTVTVSWSRHSETNKPLPGGAHKVGMWIAFMMSPPQNVVMPSPKLPV